jgi:tellurite resistance protein
MHIVLGILGTVVTILVLLNRLADAGIDLRGLNPFLWHRRRKWKQQLEGDPIYRVASPMDATALLMVAVARSDGDMSAEEKKKILEMFRSEFQLSKRDAADLMVASVYLLKDGSELRANLAKVMEPSHGKFTPEQTESATALIRQVGRIDPEPNEIRETLVRDICAILAPAAAEKGTWQ